MRFMRRRGREQRGAALVEMAIVLPLLVLLVFGILEFGLAFRDKLTVANGTQSAGRVAAALGTQDDADIATLRAVEQSLGLLPNSGGAIIKHVQIWRSNGSGSPAAACGTVGAGGSACNWYEYRPATPCNWFPCPDPDNGSLPAYGGGYLPANRDVTLDSDGLDIVGVTVLYSHDWVTGVLPIPDLICTTMGTNCWADSSLFRLEPQNFGT
jgi:hypothetical protein